MDRDEMRERVKQEIDGVDGIKCNALQALLDREQELTDKLEDCYKANEKLVDYSIEFDQYKDKCEQLTKDNEGLKLRIKELIGDSGDLSKE